MTVKRNGGTIKTTRKYYVKVYGEVWFDERDITHIFVLKNFKKNFIVTYDRNNHVFLTVHNPSGQGVHFNIHKDGPHYHNTKKRHDTLVQTLSMNDADYSKCQLKSVKLVREIDAKVGYLSQKDFKKLIKSNIIKTAQWI